MKKAVVLLFLIFPAFYSLSGQKDAFCIYNNWEDYKDGKCSYLINPDSSKDKARFYHFFPRNYIEIIKGGKKHRFYKDSIFGYRDPEKKDYRFYGNTDRAYEIIENSEIVIYVKDLPLFSSSGKTAKLVPSYFFSKELNSAILPLTIVNLKRSFSDNLKFHDILNHISINKYL